MGDLWIVARKELREQLRRGSDVLRYTGYGVVLGALFPLTYLSQGYGALVVGSLLWLSYAGITTASVATLGAFYAERQRGTLETLLATPLSDLAIFGGKVLFSLIVSLGSVFLAAGVQAAAVNVVKGFIPHLGPGLEGTFLLPPLAYLILLVTLPTVLFYTVSIGTLVSLRVGSVRTAHLINTLAVLPLVIPVTLVALVLGPHLTTRFVLAVTAIMLNVDCLVLWLALRFFNREMAVLNIPE